VIGGSRYREFGQRAPFGVLRGRISRSDGIAVEFFRIFVVDDALVNPAATVVLTPNQTANLFAGYRTP
jgi:hypothetical protein